MLTFALWGCAAPPTTLSEGAAAEEVVRELQGSTAGRHPLGLVGGEAIAGGCRVTQGKAPVSGCLKYRGKTCFYTSSACLDDAAREEEPEGL